MIGRPPSLASLHGRESCMLLAWVLSCLLLRGCDARGGACGGGSAGKLCHHATIPNPLGCARLGRGGCQRFFVCLALRGGGGSGGGGGEGGGDGDNHGDGDGDGEGREGNGGGGCGGYLAGHQGWGGVRAGGKRRSTGEALGVVEDDDLEFDVDGVGGAWVKQSSGGEFAGYHEWTDEELAERRRQVMTTYASSNPKSPNMNPEAVRKTPLGHVFSPVS
jgi:hypothetical protein